VEKQDVFLRGLALLAAGRSEVAPWIQKVNELNKIYDKALFENNSPEMAEADRAREEHWRTAYKAPEILLNALVARSAATEATYLLALCKHEEAERAQAAASRATGPEKARLEQQARDAWNVAVGAWDSFAARSEEFAQSPERMAHAKQLTDRAKSLAGMP
jgi:hypothetical protein